MPDRVADRAAPHATPADLAVRDWLLVALSLSTGIYEAICFLTFGKVFTAAQTGFIKLIVDAERGVSAGATSAGPDGGEVLSMLTLEVHAGIPVQRLQEMIYPCPTFHGAVPEAIGRLTWPRPRTGPRPIGSPRPLGFL